MNTKKITFTNQENHKIAARLELPLNKRANQFAIFAHCFTCNKNLTAVRAISRALTQHGIGVLRIDFTGLGESEGDFSETNFSSNVQDLIDAQSYLAEHYKAATLLVGHSLGGSAALLAADMLDAIEAIVTIGAPSDPNHVTHLFADNLQDIEEQGKATVSIGGRSFDIQKQFLADIQSVNLPELVKSLRKPYLILHAPLDKTVGIEHASNLYKWAHHPKSFVSLDGADHLISNKEDALYVGEVIGSWSKRYLPKKETQIVNSNSQVHAQATDEKFTTNILAENHHLTADEPEDMGGNAFGPSPYGLVSSGLAACTVMTIKMYAERKGWTIDNLEVEVNHNKQHSEDCENCSASSSKIDHFERVVKIEGDLDKKQLSRLMEIANKCPVHKTLTSNATIETSLK